MEIGVEAGSVVIMGVHSGELLALASTPSFDPNAFNLGLDSRQWRALMRHPRTPLVHRAIGGQYAPGSTFKMIVALAGLEAGTVSADHRVFCSGKMEFGDRFFHCWKKGGHGVLSLPHAIEQSCDIHFYDVARRVGVDRIGKMARRFGFGAPTGIDIEGEEDGLVPSREWMRRRHGRPWHQGETLLSGIGQGYLLATPLQLAVMTAQIANGGFRVRPTLIAREPPAERPAPESLGLSAASLSFVQRAMDMVSNSPRGTAYRARIREPGMAVAGKTGTVQVRRITEAERRTGVLKNEELPWKERDHALFVGFAPVDAPRYAVAVVVEHGGGGSSTAAPVARDVLAEALKRDPDRAPAVGKPVANATPGET